MKCQSKFYFIFQKKFFKFPIYFFFKFKFILIFFYFGNLLIYDLFRVKTGGLLVSKQEESDSDEEDEKEIKYEGHLYKITKSKKLKKLWFKLVHRDLYYFKSKEEKSHRGMHNLSGVFIKEELSIKYEGMDLYCFSVVYPKKIRNYYVSDTKEFKDWINFMQKATGYSSLTDIYDVKVILLFKN